MGSVMHFSKVLVRVVVVQRAEVRGEKKRKMRIKGSMVVKGRRGGARRESSKGFEVKESFWFKDVCILHDV